MGFTCALSNFQIGEWMKNLDFWENDLRNYDAKNSKRLFSFLLSSAMMICFSIFVLQKYDITEYLYLKNIENAEMVCIFAVIDATIGIPLILFGLTALLYKTLPTKIFYSQK